MHPYQVDEGVYKDKILFSIFLSVIFAYFLNITITFFFITIPWWIDMPSVLGFFGFFIWYYDNYLWKSNFLIKLKLVKIPNLNGKWETEGGTSQNKFETPIPGQIIIHQTASKISIALETNTSISQSLIAAIIRTENLNKYELTYNYINKPKVNTTLALQIHYGTASFRISDDLKSLDGEYYTGRGRQTYGSVKAKYIDKLIN